eukprot:758714-Hanusia_phi.AAC.3
MACRGGTWLFAAMLLATTELVHAFRCAALPHGRARRSSCPVWSAGEEADGGRVLEVTSRGNRLQGVLRCGCGRETGRTNDFQGQNVDVL